MNKERGYMMQSKSDDWETPSSLFKELDMIYLFTLDPCATPKNAKCKNYFTKEQDGLKQKWFGNVFVNPPFKDVDKWVAKAEHERKNVNFIVMLIAARTDTRWFHKYLYDTEKGSAREGITIRFLKGRVKYKLNGTEVPAPFPSMIIIFRKEDIGGDGILKLNTRVQG